MIVCRQLVGILLALCFAAPAGATEIHPPRVAHHQHLFSPELVAIGEAPLVILAKDLVAELDRAGIQRGVVLSTAYTFADERLNLPHSRALLEQDNNWTSAQVAATNGRLVGFCSVNPLTDYAVDEIARCNKLPAMHGIKLHLGNSGVSLRRPEHVTRLRAVFAIAEQLHLPIVVHMRARSGMPYGAQDAAIFLDEVLPVAPDIVVQVAHFGGAGPGYPDYADAAMSVLAGAVARHEARAQNLYFDVATIATLKTTPETGALIARRIREVGSERILFGSDAPVGGNPQPKEAWDIFKEHVPLTETEFNIIASNVAPYLLTSP